jgi:hypothetical protein
MGQLIRLVLETTETDRKTGYRVNFFDINIVRIRDRSKITENTRNYIGNRIGFNLESLFGSLAGSPPDRNLIIRHFFFELLKDLLIFNFFRFLKSENMACSRKTYSTYQGDPYGVGGGYGAGGYGANGFRGQRAGGGVGQYGAQGYSSYQLDNDLYGSNYGTDMMATNYSSYQMDNDEVPDRYLGEIQPPASPRARSPRSYASYQNEVPDRYLGEIQPPASPRARSPRSYASYRHPYYSSMPQSQPKSPRSAKPTMTSNSRRYSNYCGCGSDLKY